MKKENLLVLVYFYISNCIFVPVINGQNNQEVVENTSGFVAGRRKQQLVLVFLENMMQRYIFL